MILLLLKPEKETQGRERCPDELTPRLTASPTHIFTHDDSNKVYVQLSEKSFPGLPEGPWRGQREKINVPPFGCSPHHSNSVCIDKKHHHFNLVIGLSTINASDEKRSKETGEMLDR